VKTLFLVAVVSALLLSSQAEARDWRRSGVFMQAQGQRADEDRNQYRRDDRNAQRAGQNGRKRERRDRLTDEERRELHRDLDRARREIYRGDRKR
jgi:hypothetical protein